MGIKEASEVPAPCVALENGESNVNTYESLDSPVVGKEKIGFA
ncbi:urease accessory protein UreH-like, partial [Trifolium medium]|nr:urease accessory protein UreH-like [Trifolium medium]